MEERLRILQSRLNHARHANNAAVRDEIYRESGGRPNAALEDDLQYDIPMRLLQGHVADEVTDPDIRRYLRDIRSIPDSVYLRQGSGIDDAAASNLAARLRQRQERIKQRNTRAADYDISGRYRVDFINDRNKRFNRRLAREYNEFTEDVRAKLERGSGIWKSRPAFLKTLSMTSAI